jgi:hypothetical protein
MPILTNETYNFKIKTGPQFYHHPVAKQLTGSFGYVQAFHWLLKIC